MRRYILLTLVLMLALAVAACSVETREERQQRQAQESGQQTEDRHQPAVDAAGQDEIDPGVAGQDGTGQEEADQDSAPEAPVLAEPGQPDADQPDMTPADENQPEPGQPMTLGPALEEAALQALDQHPETVVQAFFTQVMNGDLAMLEPLVAQNQRQELKDLLAYLEEQKNLPEDPLQGVDKVEVMQTSLSAVVDVNVTVRLKSGPETSAESIALVYEDGAWRIADLDF